MKCIVNNQVVLSRGPEGPLAAQVGSFAESVSKQGYSLWSIHRQVLLAACFSRLLQTGATGTSPAEPKRWELSRDTQP
jgi:integrase/recombinase XerD